ERRSSLGMSGAWLSPSVAHRDVKRSFMTLALSLEALQAAGALGATPADGKTQHRPPQGRRHGRGRRRGAPAVRHTVLRLRSRGARGLGARRARLPGAVRADAALRDEGPSEPRYT